MYTHILANESLLSNVMLIDRQENQANYAKNAPGRVSSFLSEVRRDGRNQAKNTVIDATAWSRYYEARMRKFFQKSNERVVDAIWFETTRTGLLSLRLISRTTRNQPNQCPPPTLPNLIRNQPPLPRRSKRNLHRRTNLSPPPNLPSRPPRNLLRRPPKNLPSRPKVHPRLPVVRLCTLYNTLL